MDKIIFYLFAGIIVPIIFSLFTIGITIFTIGEFKEHKKKVPLIINLLTLKLVFFVIIILHTFHYYLHNFIPESFYFVSISLNFYIILEYLQINKIFFTLRRYITNDNPLDSSFLIYLKNNIPILLKENLLYYVVLQIFGILIAIILLIITIHSFSMFNLFLSIVYLFIYSIKFYLSKYLSTL